MARILSFDRNFAPMVVCVGTIVLAGLPLSAQDDDAEASSGPQQAVIERVPLVLRNPQEFQVPLSLKPAVSVALVARVDAEVSNIMVGMGDAAKARTELLRLESTERQLELQQATAQFQLAQLLQKNGQESEDVLKARLDLARIQLTLAEHRAEETIIRAPFDGTVTDVHVVKNQFVRAGDPVLTLADLTKLTVDVPVDRKEVKQGDKIDVRVEDVTVSATVEAILPLDAKFEPLRDLFLSIATARLTIDNGGGQFHVGQTVYSDLIPRQMVTEVATANLSNTDDGRRKVQVIRDGFVRDIPVELLGQMGEDYVFVTGRFAATDELIVSSSEELLDGTRVMHSAAAPAEGQSPRPRSGPTGRPSF